VVAREFVTRAAEFVAKIEDDFFSVPGSVAFPIFRLGRPNRYGHRIQTPRVAVGAVPLVGW